MPTYDYICLDCDHKFEEYQSIIADPLVECPKCHQPTLKRLMGTGSTTIFKGSGFYITDYKKTSSSPASSSTKKPSKKTEPSSTESKPTSDKPKSTSESKTKKTDS